MKDNNKNIEKAFNFLLQRKIHIYYIQNENKLVTIKKGKLLNYNIKIPFIQYKIFLDNSKIRDFYINIPFNILYKDNVVIFSYKIKDLYDMTENEFDFLKNLSHDTDSKLYDRFVYIEYE